MGRFVPGIAGVSYCADWLRGAHQRANAGVNVLQVSVIVKPPSGAEYHHHIATQVQYPGINNHAVGGCNNGSTHGRENVYAFMHAGLSPGLKPKGIVVPVARRGASNRNDRLFG